MCTWKTAAWLQADRCELPQVAQIGPPAECGSVKCRARNKQEAAPRNRSGIFYALNLTAIRFGLA